jgi:UDP-N-acetylmuramyl pentapeptide phosphotransferase/UDP-N-acetylglucosamine-1-phosphate transferase
VLAGVACGAFVTITEPVTVALLRRVAAIDTPSHRSSHTVPTPRGGGLPIGVGLVIVALVIHSAVALTFGAVVAVFAGLGLADDLAGLPAAGRLTAQGVVGLTAGWVLASRAGLGGAAAATAAVAVGLWLVSYVNAFNFMDGVNGIAAGHALLGGVAFAGLGLWQHSEFLAIAGAAVAAGAAAFLPWNAVRARVFLGDVGSYGLGAALALLAAWAVLRGIPPEAALGPLALYLADTAWTLQRRIRAGEPWLQPHRTHAYQRLCDAGWSHQQVTILTGMLTGTLAVLGAVSLTPAPGLRVAADLAGLVLLGGYLCSPGLLAQTVLAQKVLAQKVLAQTGLAQAGVATTARAEPPVAEPPVAGPRLAKHRATRPVPALAVPAPRRAPASGRGPRRPEHSLSRRS